MVRMLSIALIVLAAGAAAAPAATIRVPEDYPTIQEGIDAAVDDDEVVVADGTWTGAGNKDIELRGKRITLRSASRDAALCIIDCEDEGRGFYVHQGEGLDTVIEGFTVRRGHLVDSGPGGGMWVRGSSPTVIGCVFEDNYVFAYGGARGGGLCVDDGGGGRIERCTFRDNYIDAGLAGGQEWTEGGGANVENATVIDCTFTANTSRKGAGGGLLCYGCALIDCTFTDNRAHGSPDSDGIGAGASGGGFRGAAGTLTRCVFVGNAATVGGYQYVAATGGGAYISDMTLTDCVFEGNVVSANGSYSSSCGGGAVYGKSITVEGCRFGSNRATSSPDPPSGGAVGLEGPCSRIDDSMFCENTPNDISGCRTGEGNRFSEACALQFTFPNGFPVFVDADGGTRIRVEVAEFFDLPRPGTGRLHYRTGLNEFVEILMEEIVPNVYDAVFPTLRCGETVFYYFSAETMGGDVATSPASAPDATYATPVYADYCGLRFTFPDGLPEFIDADGGTRIRVEVTEFFDVPRPDTGRLHHRVGEEFLVVPMEEISENVYDAVFPAAACGEPFIYYFSAETTGGNVVTSPALAPKETYSATAIRTGFEDDFEEDLGWTESSEEGDDGAWVRGVPTGGAGAPSSDSDGSGQCYVTGLDRDVDGVTTLTSPIMDASDPTAAIVYDRWFSNDEGENPESDIMRVEASDDGGATWHLVEIVGPVGPEASGDWFHTEFEVADIPSVDNTNEFRVRFKVLDFVPDSNVEAALDAVRITHCGRTCVGDIDESGSVGFPDLLLLLAAWGPCEGDCPEDLDESGVVDFGDLLVLLAAWGPCE